MPVFRHALTSDPDTPVVMFADHLPLLEESVDASAMYLDIGRRTFATYIPPVLAVMRADGAYDERTGRLKLYQEARQARFFMNRLLRREGCKVRGIRNRGGHRVSHDDRESYIDRLLTALRKFLDQGFDLGIRSGQRPLELDGWHEKDPADKALLRARQPESAAGRGSFKSDTGRYYRMPFTPWTAPRTSDVRWIRDIVAALVAARKAKFVIVPVRMAGCTAARMGEVLDANFLGWWKASRFGREILLRNKGQGDRERKRQHISPEVLDAMLDYVRGDRRDADPQHLDIEKLRRLGEAHDRGDKRATAKLRAARIFLNSRGEPLEYHALVDHHLTPVMRAAGIPATCHWIRHEYVFRRLRAIDVEARDAADWAHRREKLAEYMGWASGTEMFKVYDAFERAREAHAGAARYAEQLERDIAEAADVIAPGAVVGDEEECAELLAFGRASWDPGANDDGFDDDREVA